MVKTTTSSILRHVALSLCVSATAAAQAPQSYKGLTLKVTAVEKATAVSLTDCPPGANTVRGVIRPGDPMEFAVVKVDFVVTAAFKETIVPKPVLHDDSGKTYNTAQSFANIGGAPFTCAFAFRVPKGTTPKRLQIDTLMIEVP